MSRKVAGLRQGGKIDVGARKIRHSHKARATLDDVTRPHAPARSRRGRRARDERRPVWKRDIGRHRTRKKTDLA